MLKTGFRFGLGTLIFTIALFQGGALAGERTRQIAGASEQDRIVGRLESFGFKCDPPSFPVARLCRGKIEDYPEAIRVYIPKAVPVTEPKLIVHLHGQNLGPTRSPEFHFQEGRGDFAQWLTDAGARSILVVPESAGDNLTYGRLFNISDLKAAGLNFELFIHRLEVSVGSEFGSIALSGHSGGYMALGALALARPLTDASSKLNRVVAVGLFDAVYGRTDQLVHWIDRFRQNGGLFYGLYETNGSTLKSAPGDQRALNSWFAARGLLATESGGLVTYGKAKVRVFSVTAKHMEILRDDRYTDFLRSIDK